MKHHLVPLYMRSSRGMRRLSTNNARKAQVQGLPLMEPLHILGSGSIGLLFASSIRMAFPSYPLTMLLRAHHEPRLQRLELRSRKKYMEVSTQSAAVETTQSIGQDATRLERRRRRRLTAPRLVRLPAELIHSDDSRTKIIQNLLLTTKASDAVNALHSVLPRFASSTQTSVTRIVVLCNGAMAVRDEIQRHLIQKENKCHSDSTSLAIRPDFQLILSSTTHGAYRDDEEEPIHPNNDDDDDTNDLYHVVHAGVGKTYVEDQPKLAQLLDQSGLTCTSISSRDMELLLWQKLAANCIINPLTALLQCSNGDILEQALYHDFQQRIIAEISAVATESMRDIDGTTAAIQQLSTASLSTFVSQVIHDTAPNKSSMLQDVLREKETEIDYLNGYVVRKGTELGIDVAANRELCQRVRALQAPHH